MKKILNILICLIGILGITLGIVEVASRFYFAKEYDSSITARKKPELILSSYLSRTRATVPRTSEDEYIVFFGDSFTYGDTLPEKESYPKVFERCIKRKGSKLKVINAAVQGTGILDHYQLINRLLNNELAHLKVTKAVIGFTQNDRYIEPWGFHPYDACPNFYPHSQTRFLHHHLFSVYYLDFLLNKKGHISVKDDNTEKCFKDSLTKLKDILSEKSITMIPTFLADAIKTPTDSGVIGLNYQKYLEAFKADFSIEPIVINEVFEKLASDREIYSTDNYHFNASTNAIIGEYLCEQIKL